MKQLYLYQPGVLGVCIAAAYIHTNAWQNQCQLRRSYERWRLLLSIAAVISLLLSKHVYGLSFSLYDTVLTGFI